MAINRQDPGGRNARGQFTAPALEADPERVSASTLLTQVLPPIPGLDEQQLDAGQLIVVDNTDLAVQNRQQEFLRQLGEPPTGYELWKQDLPPEVRARLTASNRVIKHGLQAVAPLVCKGLGGCPFPTACPIPVRDPEGLQELPQSHYPLGMSCVLEGEYMAQKIADYVLYLRVDPANPIELGVVNELALLDLKKNRALLILSHGDRDGQGRDFMHVDESTIGFAEGGTPLISKTTKLHPVADYIDRIERRREKWLDKLMETRKAKADYAFKVGDIGKESKVLREIQAIRSFVEKMKTQGQVVPLVEGPGPTGNDFIGLDEEFELD